MDPRSLYGAHLEQVQQTVEQALEACAKDGDKYDGVVFHAGCQGHYHADDREVPFQAVPHFTRMAPVPGRDHLIHVAPGKKPRLARVVPRDYWYEPPMAPDHPFMDLLDQAEVNDPAEAAEWIGTQKGCAFFGDDPKVADALGIPAANQEPIGLSARLDWERAYKTPYEVECIREAGRVAAAGHAVIRDAVPGGHSERVMHAAYLEATGLMENQTPYTNIVGWDEHAAVLHYQSKDKYEPDPGHVFLIDAGAPYLGYASDITRTYLRGDVHPAFKDCLDQMETMQRELVDAVKPDLDYVELHAKAHRGVARILSSTGISKVSPEETFEQGLTHAFFPHGLGHHIGVQVHDVGGHQAKPTGELQSPPEAYPYLRTTRRLEERNVVTIEPGLYFIPMLLEPVRAGKHKASVDWDLVDALIPCGGIRIEDDVLVTETGQEDLTRPFVPGHQG